MYSPAPIREFVTPAILKRTQVVIVNGRTTKQVVQVANLRGKVDFKGSDDINANGLYVVNKKLRFITWWKTGFKASDILTINGNDYLVKGDPENVNFRNRYAILTLERIEGGA